MNRELDAQVAEKVMRLYDVHKAGKGEWLQHEGCFAFVGERVYRDDKGFFTKLPYYSTDIAAAWEVMEKLLWWWGDVDLRSNSPKWECGWEGDGGIWDHATADTAPEAICRAALKAREVEHE